MAVEFDTMISACRRAYAAFRQMASRTDDALYQALAQVYALRLQMRDNTGLHAHFDKLVEQHGSGKSANETLFLVKYAFFPHTLQPGPGHKADIPKASRYAKLINKALDENSQPVEFVTFARNHGIQRTAVASSRFAKRAPIRHKTAASREIGLAPFASARHGVVVSGDGEPGRTPDLYLRISGAARQCLARSEDAATEDFDDGVRER